MRLPQMLFGVRASQLDTYEQQAQTAKRFAKDKSQSVTSNSDIQVAWFPNPIVSRHREKRDSEALFRGWTVSNSFTFYEHGKLWEQPASKCLCSACARCPRCWIHSFSTLFSPLVPIPTRAAIITSKQRHTYMTQRALSSFLFRFAVLLLLWNTSSGSWCRLVESWADEALLVRREQSVICLQ